MTVSVVVLSEVRDLLGGIIAKSREVLRVAQDDSECCRPERSEGSSWWSYCQELGGPSRCFRMTVSVVVLSEAKDLLGLG